MSRDVEDKLCRSDVRGSFQTAFGQFAGPLQDLRDDQRGNGVAPKSRLGPDHLQQILAVVALLNFRGDGTRHLLGCRGG